MNKNQKNNTQCVIVASIQLTDFIRSALKNQIEVRRINICALSLISAGANSKSILYKQVAQYTADHQHIDGGWSDVEESLLSVKILSLIGNVYSSLVEKGNKWILSQRNPDGGWGRTNRDISRIPITGLLLNLFPSLSDPRAVNWLQREWAKDFKGATKLTYKGGFFLLGLAASNVSVEDCPSIKDTYLFLAEEQNEDGGFGPWKDHPIGSDPWSTGIVLLGLLSYPELVKRKVIEKAVNWLVDTQLPNGFWPYHYIEEGSAYAYWGLVEALKYLSRETG